ncbi:MAG: AAA family ATPase [Proteobacteria bacterium]|nr:AAA family ATPase [Pseudomonadota bacterium]MBU1388881.1 AAA family ATPase [Pseudomonadota bacterium]MBU1542262.1 AAA family ATPase [Pseudomonadota bacterium]MBU2480448.1 AAA family ATPase [Pseudomonadota bacterium]
MAIIVCPKCEKKHKVDLEALQENVSSGKITARCKSCGHKFPVQLDMPPKQENKENTEKFFKNKKDVPEIEKPVENDAEEKESGDVKAPIRRICVTLSKGGVGKTTTSVNLSAGLALAGYKVLLVDTDTQGQSAYNLGKKPRAGLTELLTKELAPEECVIRARKNLWLLSGGKALAGVKRIIDRKSFGAEWTLAEAMKEIEHRYDYVIIDTAPGWDQLIVNVLFYATEVLVPVALEVMPLQGLSEFMKSLGSIQKYRKEVVLKYIVPTFMDTRIKGPETILTQLQKLYPEYMCTPIRYCESLSEAPSYGKSIFEFAPGSTASSDYRELVQSVSMDVPVSV